MKILVVADALESIHSPSDTTIYLTKAALNRGHEVFWATPNGIFLTQSEVGFQCEPVTLKNGAVKAASRATLLNVSGVDAAWVRKDPPFDAAYLRLCWLLALAERRCWFMNRPSLLLRYHEKLVPAEAVAQGFLESHEIIDNFYKSPAALAAVLRGRNLKEAVAKPFFGFGGRDIRRVPAESVTTVATEDTLLQPFHKEVQVDGDHRLFFLGGRFIGHVARMPQPGGFVSNFAQGGHGETRPLRQSQQSVVAKLGRFLAHVGIDFAGADLIGNHISEVNITSPTGLVTMESLDGNPYGEWVLDFVEAQSKSL
ncbi:MAG: hypothetical protein KDD51_08245 [Bdellovibrionales bacterium]|nr:hypothetical protein [Bdellovibrionales bacterium]